MFHILLLLIYVIVLALSVRNLGRSPPKKSPKKDEKPKNGKPKDAGNTGTGAQSVAESLANSDKTNNPADSASKPTDSVGGTGVDTVRNAEFPTAAGEPPHGGQGPQTSGQGGHGGHGGPGDSVDGGGGEGHPQTRPEDVVSRSSGYGYTRALSRQLRI